MEQEIGDLNSTKRDAVKFNKETNLVSSFTNNHPEVQKRIQQLRKLQIEYIQKEMNYYDEIQKLEMKYAQQYAPIFKKRQEIVNGLLDFSEESGDICNIKTAAQISNENKNMVPKFLPYGVESVKGVPNFWLTVLLNSSLRKMINHCDEPVLKYLKDITLKYVSETSRDYILEFQFESNEYFSNSSLIKEYEMKCVLDPKNPYCFEGPDYARSKGCIINWKEGKNVTVEVVTKQNKNTNNLLETNIVDKESFFNFFKSLPELCENQSNDEKQILLYDFEIGQYIKDRIIPKAILYYTREIIDDSGDLESDSESLLSSSNSEEGC